MHPSNLQLNRYFLTRFDFSANPDYDVEKELDLAFDDLTVETEKGPLNQSDLRLWQVTLTLQYAGGDGRNVPYAFSSEILGIFEVCDQVPEEKVDFYVETNATSILYSTLREIIITMTAKGPFNPLLLPTVSFYEPETPKSEKPAKGRASVKKKGKKTGTPRKSTKSTGKKVN